ncbi:hypothetical protein MGYG_00022 [Nannizzia gypsea CBS 118893]|uniref:Heterokaryon incompatibility domain-containing protein n=1 Tax=Arthroderma gypseum (strain ATCC MYA-4604 / CBS 118893) TaxID=535722 RepID=E5R288_ARTGP|nr:hypothetical protein MGYG_00022 [Nannizzia gypsea CBS 118893]EFQ96978.1 hypothetical protein MGYG_00022 [Nannizzia gypsea CBS 118893]
MEGISPLLPWSLPRQGVLVPLLTSQPNPGYIAYSQEHREFCWAEDQIDPFNFCTSIHSLASVLQASLFFNFLSIYLEQPINPEDFTTDGNVDCGTDAALKMFADWKVQLSHLSYSRLRKRQEILNSLITFAYMKSDAFEDAAENFGEDETFDRIALSVKMLASVLYAVAEDTFSVLDARSTGIWAPWVSSLASSYFNKKKSTQGVFWLQNDIGPARDSIYIMGAREIKRYARGPANIFVPFPPGVEQGGRAATRLYRQFKPSEDHENCLAMQRCCAHNLILGRGQDYPFQHHNHESGDCEFIHVPRRDIITILQTGGIPLVSVSIEGDLDLQVHRFTPYIAYTAISHVWSDGLGNPHSNALPRCQLLRLRRIIYESYHSEYSPFYDPERALASVLYLGMQTFPQRSRPSQTFDAKRVYFWMDTFCIPVAVETESDQWSKELKFRAMSQITPAFAGAFNTIILDNELQEIGLPDPSQISGDEIAAMILSSKWMQRGWTLEEGCLSMNCVAQLMGKPYNIPGSLNHNLQRPEDFFSPLERVSIDSRRSLTKILRRVLLDGKHQLSSIHSPFKYAQVVHDLRLSQFVWIWNSLLERSTTKAGDGPIIVANSLGFRVSGLKAIPEEERLKAVIQSCEELPLSILYNTGRRIRSPEVPSLGWIPSTVDGDYLTTMGSLRRSKSQRADGEVKLFIHRPTGSPDGITVQVTQPGQVIPLQKEVVIVNIRSRPNDNLKRGKGVLLSIISDTETGMALQYEAPLVAWTQEQWEFRCADFLNSSVPSIDMRPVGHSQRLYLTYDPLFWNKKLTRRPELNKYPLLGNIVTALVTLPLVAVTTYLASMIYVAIRDALGIPSGPSPHATVFIYIFGPICAIIAKSLVENRIAAFWYISWLKSLEEQPLPRKSTISTTWVALVNINLLPMQRPRSQTLDLPGEIYLE